MLGTKNFSPKQLSAFTATALAIPVALAFYLDDHSWKVAFSALIIMFGFSYFVVSQVLERFIYRKIKLIYKFINQTKASKKEEMYYKYILPQKSIDEVREDVERWAVLRKAEIEALKVNEKFRRDFLQNFSHEIKTPVFAIQGYTEILLDGEMDNPESCKRFLDKINSNVDRMVHLVQDMDEISDLENGRLKINPEKFIIQELINEVFESVAITTSQRNINCYIKKGCESPISVVADRDKMRQVLSNLVINAIKYGHDDGYVMASVYKMDNEHVLLEISDNGIGIAEEHLPRVFERFYRTDSSRSRKIGGSGLGLAICKHILEAQNQSIHIRSKLNIGTTIGFTLSVK